MVEIFMPKAGFDMKEGRLIRWLKDVGDAVELDEPIIEIETDKVTMEAEAPASGILLAKLIEDGTSVPVLQTIGYIGQAGEKVPEPEVNTTITFKKDSPSNHEAADSVQVYSFTCNNGVAATPYAKKLAKDAGIDLSSITPAAANQPLRG